MKLEFEVAKRKSKAHRLEGVPICALRGLNYPHYSNHIKNGFTEAYAIKSFLCEWSRTKERFSLPLLDYFSREPFTTTLEEVISEAKEKNVIIECFYNRRGRLIKVSIEDRNPQETPSDVICCNPTLL